MLLLTALYVIPRPVCTGISLFAAFCKLLYVLFWFVFLLDLFGALRLVESRSFPRFEPDAVAALASMQLDSSRDACYIGLLFNGLESGLFA